MSKKELKLPVGKFPEDDNKWLSMDEYIEFINFCANNFPRNKLSKADEMAMRVNVPFIIK